MKKIFLLNALFLLLIQPLMADSSFFGGLEQPKLVVNNRILAKVNGKVISVIDTMKKMDMHFYRQFPEYTSSTQARFQFYQANWKHVLQELIDKELIMADAEEAKIPLGLGDVRKEIETLFGPNIINNLDKVGLTFEEASQMVQSDLIIRRMLFVRVHSKAMRQITPQVVRNRYEQIAKDRTRDKEWHYRVISIREKNPQKAAEMAHMVHSLLSTEGVPLEALPEKLKENSVGEVKIPSLNISDEYKHTEKELSKAFKEILTNQEPGTYSEPFAQKSRTDQTTVYRIFYLNSMVPGGVIPFSELENEIRDELVNVAIAKETQSYLNKLRKHFDVQENQLKEMVAEDFEPFALK